MQEKKWFLDEFCAVYFQQALAAGLPETAVFTEVDEIEDDVLKLLEAQKQRAVETINAFNDMRLLFSYIGEDRLSQLTVNEQLRFVWARPYLESLPPESASRILSAEHWDALVYMLNALPPNLVVFKSAFSWLQRQVDFCDLSSLMRALGYVTHLPECTTQEMMRLMYQGSIPLRPWWTHRIGADVFSQLIDRLDSFRNTLTTLLTGAKNRWNKLLPRGLAASLFAMRSPLVIEREILAIRRILLLMPQKIQQPLYTIDADIVLFLFSSIREIVWLGSEADALCELLVLYAHLQPLGLANNTIIHALQEAREEILLRQDPFLMDRPLFDPCLALLTLSEAQLQGIKEYSDRPRELKQIFLRLVEA